GRLARGEVDRGRRRLGGGRLRRGRGRTLRRRGESAAVVFLEEARQLGRQIGVASKPLLSVGRFPGGQGLQVGTEDRAESRVTVQTGDGFRRHEIRPSQVIDKKHESGVSSQNCCVV